MFSKSVLAASTCLLAGLSAPVFAQDEQDTVRVVGRYLSLDQINAVRTPTPIVDVPQSLSLVSEEQIENQAFTNIGDVLRFTPGLSVSQGEGHRDAIIIRGNQTTADFFLNGVRDDVQYFRPLYNIEQVEILRGSNALLFGRGGGGGVINRVAKEPEIGERFSSVSAGVDTFGAYLISADTNIDIDDRSAFRLNAFVEGLNNHRDFYDGTRYGVNPTFAVALDGQTTLNLSYEYLNDDRVVDRGVPSVTVANGPDVPLEGFSDTFFGSPDQNFTTLEAHIFRARLDRTFSTNLRGNVTLQYADYDKLYQNLYAAGFDQTVTPNTVTLDGYRDPTARQNLIIQGNLIGEYEMGPFGHTFLMGVEYGSQDTANMRLDNFFPSTNDDQAAIPFTDPLNIPAFGFTTPARDRESDVSFTSLYLQDQIDITDTFKLIVGVRFDRFDVSVLDRAAVSPTDNGRRGRVDEEFSPRFGFIYKPADNVSFYASYSETFLPSSGDQFLTLSTTTEDIRPQSFENREIGFKWDITRMLSLTAALFRLERGFFTTVDPDDASIVTTVPGSTIDGFEIQLVGDLTDDWFVSAGFSQLDGEVNGGGNAGNRPRQTPETMISFWTQYQLTDRLSIGGGATHQGEFFVLEDNSVLVPSYTRVDAAVFYDLSDDTRVQLNIENLLDEDYFPDAHSNDNISTGEPLNARLTVRHRF
ncbi:TonB-dependent siderophore receptor [Hyphobacterium sp. HN65]|uniref:TonB-dependent siderophore receptor n=1 Tax=Hyphobacterium lacteum TaxID=3116575 RepID=A0ABU7LR27_9PROT|nr:TonB-dependent siderophore receptor [Hyphobacterium sp. HN65]MEE2526369.1 TonB-dependent siderophore receptor [Hyphobacterium sp. HN65]